MADMLNPATVAKVLGVTEVTLLNWRRRRVGPEWIKRGRNYFYHADRFQEYLEAIGPLPESDDPWTRRRFFATAHNPEETPERKATLEEALATLAERVEVLELALDTGAGL